MDTAGRPRTAVTLPYPEATASEAPGRPQAGTAAKGHRFRLLTSGLLAFGSLATGFVAPARLAPARRVRRLLASGRSGVLKPPLGTLRGRVPGGPASGIRGPGVVRPGCRTPGLPRPLALASGVRSQVLAFDVRSQVLASGVLPSAILLPRAADDPPVTISRNPAREAAKRELSKRMYHENDPGLLHRALNRFLAWIHDLFNAASGVTPGGGLGLFVIVLVVLALAAALWWRLGAPRRSPTSAAPLFHDRPHSAAQHRATAEAHAAEGHWNQAVQERMRALVRALEERALLEPRPGRTADEAAAEAAVPLPSHADRLRAAAWDFDDVAYGGRSGDQSAYQRISALDEDLERTRPVLAGAGTVINRTSHDSASDHTGTGVRRAPE